MLKWLAIILGLVIIISRGYGVFFPDKMKMLVAKLTSKDRIMRVWGIIVLILSLLIFLALGVNTSGAKIVMWIIAILALIGGLLLAFVPKQYGVLANWFMKLPDEVIRILSAVGVALGLLILILGLFFY
jgi:uncharacterized protein YjeT (DUF2065 family)